MNNYLKLKKNKYCGDWLCKNPDPHTHINKSIFSSWDRFYHWLYHRLFGHKIIHEFKKGSFENGWRGDKWCRYCSWFVYSRDSTRMVMFGSFRITYNEKTNRQHDINNNEWPYILSCLTIPFRRDPYTNVAIEYAKRKHINGK